MIWWRGHHHRGRGLPASPHPHPIAGTPNCRGAWTAPTRLPRPRLWLASASSFGSGDVGAASLAKTPQRRARRWRSVELGVTTCLAPFLPSWLTEDDGLPPWPPRRAELSFLPLPSLATSVGRPDDADIFL